MAMLLSTQISNVIRCSYFVTIFRDYITCAMELTLKLSVDW